MGFLNRGEIPGRLTSAAGWLRLGSRRLTLAALGCGSHQLRREYELTWMGLMLPGRSQGAAVRT